MRIVLAAALLICLGVGSATARRAPTFSVAEVVARHIELNGRVVRVRGWIRECHGRSCSLYEAAVGAKGGGAEAAWLSIGWAPAFDRQVRQLGVAQIEVEARVHAVCFNDPMPTGVVEVCADRVDQLQNPRLIKTVSQLIPT